uniref:Uncharacterized protein n=1 Tax=Hyaloperonospora arabidopsidis (strain Emoy2) TaxID=559515 RepID=M4BKK7_HYAAE
MRAAPLTSRSARAQTSNLDRTYFLHAHTLCATPFMHAQTLCATVIASRLIRYKHQLVKRNTQEGLSACSAICKAADEIATLRRGGKLPARDLNVSQKALKRLDLVLLALPTLQWEQLDRYCQLAATKPCCDRPHGNSLTVQAIASTFFDRASSFGVISMCSTTAVIQNWKDSVKNLDSTTTCRAKCRGDPSVEVYSGSANVSRRKRLPASKIWLTQQQRLGCDGWTASSVSDQGPGVVVRRCSAVEAVVRS